MSDIAALVLTRGLTVSACVYLTNRASGWKTVIQKERSGGLAYALSANSDAGKPNTTVRIVSYDRQLSNGNRLTTNTWTHLAGTYDGACQRLYINSSQAGSRAQTGNFAVSTNPLRSRGSNHSPKLKRTAL